MRRIQLLTPLAPGGSRNRLAVTRARALSTGSLLLISFLLAACSGGEPSPPSPSQDNLGDLRHDFNRDAPNIVVVMTDDQGADTMAAMPKTKRLLGGPGTTFTNNIVSFPLCCPSRAAFLTGQYAQNNGVKDNGPPDGGIGALDQSETLPVWLRRDGYDTTFVGKYLNGYGKEDNGGPTFVPPGWVNWYALTAGDKTSAYNYDINENGELVHYGDAPSDYKTDVMSSLASSALRRSLSTERPFFMWVATSDPHTDNGLGPDARRNPLPAPRDLGAFKGTKPPSDPGYDEADVGDKPDWIQELPRLSKEQKEAIRTLYVSQLESLGAVDDLVATLVKQLRHNRELRNTIFVFTSDNGFIRGQHRIDSGKSLIYEPSLQVPLIVAGPGFESGERMSQPVANVDMAPTLLRAAGATPTLPQDGVPLQPITDASKTRPPILLEIYGRKDGNTFGVRTSRFVYAEHSSGFQELYDLRNDPFELANVAGNPKYRNAQQDLAETLNKLRGCAGATCHLRSG